MKRILVAVFILTSSFVFSQNKPSSYEVIWAFTHPFKIVVAKKITKHVLLTVDSLKQSNVLDKFNYGGKLDAFRHAYWMALLAQKMSVKKALKLGKAHEKNNKKQFRTKQFNNDAVPDSVSIAMDLNNNEIGAKFGKINKDISTFEIKNEIIDKINNGDFLIIKRDKLANFVDVDGNIVPLKDQKENWNNKKCLVPSNK